MQDRYYRYYGVITSFLTNLTNLEIDKPEEYSEEAVNEILTTFDVPVIFITAYPESLLTGERPEPTFLIAKPFREDMVKAVISQALFFRTAATSPLRRSA